MTAFQLMRPLAVLGAKGAVIGAKASGRIALLLWFVGLEIVTPAQPEADPDQDFDPDPDPEPAPGRPPQDKLGWALSTLGLTRDDLTPDTLKQAYRQAIRAAQSPRKAVCTSGAL